MPGEVADAEEDDRRPDPASAAGTRSSPRAARRGTARARRCRRAARIAHAQRAGRAGDPKLAASTSSAPPGLPARDEHAAERRRARTPRIERLSPSSAFACCSRTVLTTSGISPCEAGITNPSASPKTSAEHGEHPHGRVTGDQERPATACTAPWTIAAATSTRWRGSRSASTPAASVIAAAAPGGAAITSPSAVGESVIREHREGERDRRDAVAERRDRSCSRRRA